MSNSNHSKAVLSGIDEMEYKTYESQFGDERSVSIPAQFRFTDTPTQNTRRFHVELGRRGYAPVDPDPDRRAGDDIDSLYYAGEICSRDHYKRMDVKMMRGDIVRLYPLDEWDVSTDELGDILEAIEVGFGTPLEHEPID